MGLHHCRINGRTLSNRLRQAAATIGWIGAHGVRFEEAGTALIDGSRTWLMFEGGHGPSLIRSFPEENEGKGGS